MICPSRDMSRPFRQQTPVTFLAAPRPSPTSQLRWGQVLASILLSFIRVLVLGLLLTRVFGFTLALPAPPHSHSRSSISELGSREYETSSSGLSELHNNRQAGLGLMSDGNCMDDMAFKAPGVRRELPLLGSEIPWRNGVQNIKPSLAPGSLLSGFSSLFGSNPVPSAENATPKFSTISASSGLPEPALNSVPESTEEIKLVQLLFKIQLDLTYRVRNITFAEAERLRAQEIILFAQSILGESDPTVHEKRDADSAQDDHTSKKKLEMPSRKSKNGSKSNKPSTFATAMLNNAIVTYTATVGVGSPPVNYTLILDTGSSNTWVGAQANKPYVRTNTSYATPSSVHVTYGSGSFSGIEYIDTVTLSPTLIIKNQSLGAADASNTKGFDGVDGILGVGPAALTKGTLTPEVTKEIPTVVDNLYKQGTIKNASIGVFFHPTSYATLPGPNAEVFPQDGELTFGDIDRTKLVANVEYTPITKTLPAGVYWGIDQSIRYGAPPHSSSASSSESGSGEGNGDEGTVSGVKAGGGLFGSAARVGPSTSILGKTAGIVDTGTTLTLIATDAFNIYKNLTGGVPDANTGLLRLDAEGYKKLKSLWFVVGSNPYELIPNAQLFPRGLNEAIGGDKDGYYLIIADIGQQSGKGLDFINGYTFLQRYYSVYDTGNKRVGFAPTLFTRTNSN